MKIIRAHRFRGQGTAEPGCAFCATEVTEGVVGARRLGVLRDLGARLPEVRALEDVLTATEDCRAAESHDLPFTLTYLVDDEG